MFSSLLRQKKESGSRGRLRKDRSTKRLVRRLRSGEIALISHRDLDWTAAEGLLHCGVRAVLNTGPFCSGLFPPAPLQQLLRRRVHLVENLGEPFFESVAEGERVTVEGGSVFCRGVEIGRGSRLTEKGCERLHRSAMMRREEITENFLVNTLDHAYRERRLITENFRFPTLKTVFQDRDAVVVVRGKGFRDDLRALQSYLREMKPVLVGVDGGGDALLEFGLTPDLIIGDMDSVSDEALRRARDVVVHAYSDGRGVPGRGRLEGLGLPYRVFSAPGTSEDIALLLAHDLGAALIVAVGTHFSMTEFLEKGRMGMASTFLVRLRVGDRLIDAKGVSRLYRPQSAGFLLPLAICAGLSPLLTMVFYSPPVRHLLRLLLFRLRLLP